MADIRTALQTALAKAAEKPTVKLSQRQKIWRFLQDHPWKTSSEVTKALGLELGSVSSQLNMGTKKGIFEKRNGSRFNMPALEYKSLGEMPRSNSLIGSDVSKMHEARRKKKALLLATDPPSNNIKQTTREANELANRIRGNRDGLPQDHAGREVFQPAGFPPSVTGPQAVPVVPVGVPENSTPPALTDLKAALRLTNAAIAATVAVDDLDLEGYSVRDLKRLLARIQELLR